MSAARMGAWLAAAALLAGCAGTGAGHQPLVDLRPGQAQTYAADLVDCQAYAHQVAGAGDGAAAGAVGGAIVMGVLSAILGGGGHGRWAAAGAVSGGLSGAAAGEANQRAVVVRCMSGRGYTVLN